jgi:multidrug efflux pump subunit AcrB
LLQVASVQYSQDFPLIRRRDRVPTLTVQADVPAGIQPATIVRELRSKIAALTLPAGYKIELGGTEEA